MAFRLKFSSTFVFCEVMEIDSRIFGGNGQAATLAGQTLEGYRKGDWAFLLRHPGFFLWILQGRHGNGCGSCCKVPGN